MRFRPARRAHGHLRGVGIALAAAALAVGSLSPGTDSVRAATSGINVRLPLGHEISGRITSPAGDPVANADVSAASDTESIMAQTGPDGRYVLHAVRDGTYRVIADDRAGVFDFRYYGVPDSVADGIDATLVVVSNEDVGGIDIRLGSKAPTGISGTVRGPEGQPIAGVRIFAGGEVASGQATSGPDGSYRIAGLPSGGYHLIVEPSDGSEYFSGPYVDGTIGFPDAERTIIAVGVTDTTGVDIALVRGRVITGRVTMARPATIRIGMSGPGFAEAITDANGVYRLQGLVPGEYQLFFLDHVPGPENTETGGFVYGAYGPGGALVPQEEAASVDVTDGDATLATVHLPRGTDIVGQVTDGKVGQPYPFLFVCDATGFNGCASATGAANGTFRIRHVPSGRFTIYASVTGRVTGYFHPTGFMIDQRDAGTVKVVSGKPDVKGVEIVLPPGGIVTGRITGPAGVPIAGATVVPTPSGIAPNTVLARSGADGRYRVTGTPTNVYGISVQAPPGSNYLSGYYLAGAPGNYTSDFELGTTFRIIEEHDREAPTDTFRDPAAGATDVRWDAAVITVRFSEPVDGIAPATMQLRDPAGQVVTASVSFDPEFRTATLVPNDFLTPDTRYRVTLSSAIRDWSGNRLQGSSWTFRTAP